MQMKVVKFSAYVPENQYLRFTQKARETCLKRKGKTRGAIADGIIEAMEFWISKDV